MNEEITLDLLIHPYYGFPYADRERRGVFQTWYRALIPFLSERKISASGYADALTQLYLNRFSMYADHEHYRVLLIKFNLGCALSESLAARGCAILGSRFKTRTDLECPVPQIFPEVLRSSKVTIEAFGEVSSVCVDEYSHLAYRSLSAVGLSVDCTIIPELCGDRVEGKEELFR
ncbi:hypothetical protein HYT55_01645 [Candidatus Woesearchaeota archaeon]|nr:hypothetical protein [Candidatus Woesearchaeota archaeon]